jgi:hypothetical protein
MPLVTLSKVKTVSFIFSEWSQKDPPIHFIRIFDKDSRSQEVMDKTVYKQPGWQSQRPAFPPGIPAS